MGLLGTDVMKIPTVTVHTLTTGSSASSSLNSTTLGLHLWQMLDGILTILESFVKSWEASSHMTSLATLEVQVLVTGGTGLGMVLTILGAGHVDLEGGGKG